jgi:hypothetical protein
LTVSLINLFIYLNQIINAPKFNLAFANSSFCRPGLPYATTKMGQRDEQIVIIEEEWAEFHEGRSFEGPRLCVF